ncbi:MAG: hypothetical protein ABIO70_09185 [Pseudomonadota bacterium]
MTLSWLAVLPVVLAEPAATPEPPLPPAFPAQVLPHCLYGLDPHDEAVRPHPGGPHPRGYRVRPPGALHLLAFLGFERGDLLTAVNGLPLGTAEQGFAARRALEGVDACRWAVERDGAALTLAASIIPGAPQPLVLAQDAQGLAARLGRVALWQRLSDPYAYGRYPSLLAVQTEAGVFALDDGLQALLADLGLRPLDHLIAADGLPLTGGLDVATALGRMLTEPSVSWNLERGGRPLTLTLAIEGSPVALPPLPPDPSEPPR